MGMVVTVLKKSALCAWSTLITHSQGKCGSDVSIVDFGPMKPAPQARTTTFATTAYLIKHMCLRQFAIFCTLKTHCSKQAVQLFKCLLVLTKYLVQLCTTLFKSGLFHRNSSVQILFLINVFQATKHTNNRHQFILYYSLFYHYFCILTSLWFLLYYSLKLLHKF